LKTLVPQAARLWLKQVSEARKLVSANSQVRGCPAGKIHKKQYPVKVKPFWQNRPAVLPSIYFSQQSSGCLHKGLQRLAAWTSLPLTEVEPDQSAVVFSATTCRGLPGTLHSLCRKKCESLAPSS